MGALPDLRVEIAFDSGWTTPAVDRTWTDVSDYVEVHEGIGIGVGRADELSHADANTLSLVLDNTDGRFTPGNASSPYYPNLKIGRPIRVTATPDGEAASVRFVGYLDSIPVAWESSDEYAKVSSSASSRISRLGTARALRSVVEEEILLAEPGTYFTLGEPEGGTTASDSAGNGQQPLTQVGSGAAVAFGIATGPGTDGLTAATFAGGKYLRGELASPLGSSQQWARCSFNTSTTPGTDTYLVDTAPSGGTALHGIALLVTTTGTVRGLVTHASGTLILESASAFNDGATHDSFIYAKSGASVLYVDGIAVDTDATVVTLRSDIDLVSIGGQALANVGEFTGVIAHAAVGSTVVDATQTEAQADAALTGFSGETPGDRIVRYASYAGVPADEIEADTGTPPISHIDTTGVTALEMMRKVEATEAGVLFDGVDGTLTFHHRARRYVAESAFEIPADEDRLQTDYSPQFDLQALTNVATAKTGDESVTATAVNTSSVDDYGPRSTEIELHTTDANEPHAAAWWRVNTYGEPTPRVPSLSVNLLEFDDPGTVASLLSISVGSRITVTGLPDQAANGTEDYFVEGYTESITLDRYLLTFNVSPASPVLSTWVLEDANRSQLGDTTRLAY